MQYHVAVIQLVVQATKWAETRPNYCMTLTDVFFGGTDVLFGDILFLL